MGRVARSIIASFESQILIFVTNKIPWVRKAVSTIDQRMINVLFSNSLHIEQRQAYK
jgi:hypothetical protein